MNEIDLLERHLRTMRAQQRAPYFDPDECYRLWCRMSVEAGRKGLKVISEQHRSRSGPPNFRHRDSGVKKKSSANTKCCTKRKAKSEPGVLPLNYPPTRVRRAAGRDDRPNVRCSFSVSPALPAVTTPLRRMRPSRQAIPTQWFTRLLASCSDNAQGTS